jgi:hypothetical protein
VTVDGWDDQRRAAAWTALADVALRPGRVQRRVVHVTTALPPDTAILGNGFLAGRVLTIDLPTRLIHVSGAGMDSGQRRPSRPGSQ